MVQGLAYLATSRAVYGEGFRNLTVHHVSLQVRDLARSSEFYARAFGCVILKRDDGTVLLPLGKGHIILRRGSPTGTVDHFAIGIDGFAQEAVLRDLKARGADPSVVGMRVKDPDGVSVQVTSNVQASPGDNYIGAPTAFGGSSLDHVSIYVSDLKRSAGFYQRAFDCSVSEAGATLHLSIGKAHISLRESKPPGQVDHFAVGINPFDEEAIVRKLRARGAEPKYRGNIVEGLHVVDPDGYPVQVIASSI